MKEIHLIELGLELGNADGLADGIELVDYVCNDDVAANPESREKGKAEFALSRTYSLQ